MLTYPQLLDRAITESKSLETQLKDLKSQDYELSSLRNRIDIKNLDAHHEQRKEIFTHIYYLEADLKRSRGNEAILRRQIAEDEGQDQVRPLAGAVTLAA